MKVLLTKMLLAAAALVLFALAASAQCTPGTPKEIAKAEERVKAARQEYDRQKTPGHKHAIYSAQAWLNKLECKATH